MEVCCIEFRLLRNTAAILLLQEHGLSIKIVLALPYTQDHQTIADARELHQTQLNRRVFVDVMEPRSVRIERLALERLELWKWSLAIPQQNDGFQPECDGDGEYDDDGERYTIAS